MNLPNKLTISRIVLAFIFMFFIFSKGLMSKVFALVIFTVAAFTDWLDGRIAKSRNLITDFGKIMDPIADKVLILASFLSFIQFQLIPAWMVMVIIARELLITSLRIFALSRDKVIAASKAGKHKTVSQIIVIFIILLSLILKEIMQNFFFWEAEFDKIIRLVTYWAMFSTVALTIISGVSYLWNNRKLLVE